MIVLEQIDKLLYSSEPNVQRDANNYLTKWQRSIGAWAESHSILNGNYSIEAKFIASQTLRIKILYDFYQLPPDYFLKIGESLLSYLNKDDLPRNISFTLALAVCDMAIQMADSWESPVESFVNYYKSNRLSLEMVLFLLETLPEETSNNRLILIPEHHSKITKKLKSEYGKVVEFLSVVRNNLTQLTSGLNSNNGPNSPTTIKVLNYKMLGKILKVWNNWKRFDTFSTGGEICRNFLNDCLEITRNPGLRNEGLEDETYEISVDCIVDSLQECAYLTNKQVYGLSHRDDYEYEREEEVSMSRYNELVELQKACFNVLVKQMQPQLIEAFKNRDVFLYNNLSRLFVNLVDSVHIDHKTADTEVMLLMDYLIKLIALPYLLLYSSTSVSELVNPFKSDYNHMKCREVIINYINNLNINHHSNNHNLIGNINSSNHSMIGTVHGGTSMMGNMDNNTNCIMDLDDEICNISQKSVYVLVDILSKFPKSLGNGIVNVSSLSSESSRGAGLFQYLASNVLELALLVSIPSYKLYVCSNTSGEDRMNYTEHLDNYNYYLNQALEVYDELLRIVNRNVVFEYLRMNLLNLSNFGSNMNLIHSSYALLPPCVSITAVTMGPRSGVAVSRTESVQAVERLILVVRDVLNSSGGGWSAPTSVYEHVLLMMVKINSIKFLGNVRKVFAVPETHQVLKEAFLTLATQLAVDTSSIKGGGLGRSNMEDLLELYERVKYESCYNIFLICYHVKMDKLSNSEEVLTILLSCLDKVDGESLVMILEGLATSCYNLNPNYLLSVFTQLIGNTLLQLENIVKSVPPNTPIPTSNISAGDRAMMVKLLNRIVGFVRNLKNRPALEPVVGERIIPTLLSLLKIFYLDGDLVEVICRCVKHNARVLDVHFSKHIPALVQTISAVAQVKMVGTYLYLIEWLHSLLYTPETIGKMGSAATGVNAGGNFSQPTSGSASRSISPNSQASLSVNRAEIMNLYNLLTHLTLNLFKSSYNNYSEESLNNDLPHDGDGHSSSRSNFDLDGYADDNELLIEDFYGLQAEFFLNSDVYLSDINTIDQIINCSCKFMFIRRPQCVFYFWESLLKITKKNHQISMLASQYLQTVVNNCFLILKNGCSSSTEHHVEDLIISVMSYVRSNHFIVSNAVGSIGNFNQHTGALDSGDKRKYVELMFTNGLNCLPSEIIGNEKLKASFLNGLVTKTTSTINHLYKLLSKLSMRNRM